VASGTATVEAALVGNPFVVVYRVAPTTWKLGRRLVNLESFAMVNLIAGKKVVPELIQEDFTAEKVVKALRNLLPDGVERSQIMEGLAEVRKKLHPSSDSVTAAERAADAILKVVEQRN
jgi:lipid-A-disaccharide synthase